MAMLVLLRREVELTMPELCLTLGIELFPSKIIRSRPTHYYNYNEQLDRSTTVSAAAM